MKLRSRSEPNKESKGVSTAPSRHASRRSWATAASVAVLATLGLGVPARGHDYEQHGSAAATADRVATEAGAVAAAGSVAVAGEPAGGDHRTLPHSTAVEAEAVPEPARTAESWGVEILGVRSLAAGYMLDFRYRVVDPEKAAQLHSRTVKPYLVDEASGARMAVPSFRMTGPLRTKNPPQSGRTYFVVFANPGRFIKPGNPVTVVIGDFTARARVDQ